MENSFPVHVMKKANVIRFTLESPIKHQEDTKTQKPTPSCLKSAFPSFAGKDGRGTHLSSRERADPIATKTDAHSDGATQHKYSKNGWDTVEKSYDDKNKKPGNATKRRIGKKSLFNSVANKNGSCWFAVHPLR